MRSQVMNYLNNSIISVFVYRTVVTKVVPNPFNSIPKLCEHAIKATIWDNISPAAFERGLNHAWSIKEILRSNSHRQTLYVDPNKTKRSKLKPIRSNKVSEFKPVLSNSQEGKLHISYSLTTFLGAIKRLFVFILRRRIFLI